MRSTQMSYGLYSNPWRRFLRYEARRWYRISIPLPIAPSSSTSPGTMTIVEGLDELSQLSAGGLSPDDADAEGSVGTTAAGAHKRGRIIRFVMKLGRCDLDFPRPQLPLRLSMLLLLPIRSSVRSLKLRFLLFRFGWRIAAVEVAVAAAIDNADAVEVAAATAMAAAVIGAAGAASAETDIVAVTATHPLAPPSD